MRRRRRGRRRRKRRPRRSGSLGRRAKLPAGQPCGDGVDASRPPEQECGGERNERRDGDVRESRRPIEEDVRARARRRGPRLRQRRDGERRRPHSPPSAAPGTRPSVHQIERHVTPPATPRQRASWLRSRRCRGDDDREEYRRGHEEQDQATGVTGSGTSRSAARTGTRPTAGGDPEREPSKFERRKRAAPAR